MLLLFTNPQFEAPLNRLNRRIRLLALIFNVLVELLRRTKWLLNVEVVVWCAFTVPTILSPGNSRILQVQCNKSLEDT